MTAPQSRFPYFPTAPKVSAREAVVSVVEVEVGVLIGRGLDDEAIARAVGCSAGTVRTYRRAFNETRAARARAGA